MAYSSDLPDEHGRQFGFASTKGAFKTRPASSAPPQKSGVLQTEITSSGQSTGSTASTVVGRNEKRNYLLIQNVGSVAVYISLGTRPRLDSVGSIILNPGDSIAFDNGIVPVGEVYAISETTGTITILEGIKQ